MTDLHLLLSEFHENWPEAAFGPAQRVLGDHHYDDETILDCRMNLRSLIAYRLQIMIPPFGFPKELHSECSLSELAATFELMDRLMAVPEAVRKTYQEQMQD